jgi:hypothetical protein
VIGTSGSDRGIKKYSGMRKPILMILLIMHDNSIMSFVFCKQKNLKIKNMILIYGPLPIHLNPSPFT